MPPKTGNQSAGKSGRWRDSGRMKKAKVYYADIRNMGDQLNVLLIRDYFGYEVERHSYLTGEVSGIGSGLSKYQWHGSKKTRMYQRLYGCVYPSVKVWGTGFMNYTDGNAPFVKRKMEFHAVRGMLTKEKVERILGKTLDIPTGDGGILVSELIKEDIPKQYDIGIIPHICDRGQYGIEKLVKQYKQACLIDISGESYGVIKQIAGCRFILSSSLHGLITADSFGIPNRHVVFSDKLLGDGFKFADYYSAYGVEHIMTDLRKEKAPSLEEIKEGYLLTKDMIAEKKHRMKEAFPLKA